MKSYKFIINGQKFTTSIKKSTPGKRIILVNDEEYEVEVEDELEEIEAKKAALKSASGGDSIVSEEKATITASTNDVLSPIPGLVLNIEVKEGDKVSVGSLLLKMEAMKMENEIKSTKGGTVSKIYVKTGDSVMENQPLVCVE